MPLDVDDEYITRDGIFLQPPGKTPLVAGFNILTRISNCLVSIIRDHSLPLVSCDETVVNARLVLGKCKCGRHVQPAAISELVQARLRNVKEVVSDLPAEFGKWPSSKCSASSEAVLFSQYESMRANIHATHLWAQSVLLERFVTSTSWGHNTRSTADVESIWEMREDISRQLLHILTNVSQQNLEPNGYFIVGIYLRNFLNDWLNSLHRSLKHAKWRRLCSMDHFEKEKRCRAVQRFMLMALQTFLLGWIMHISMATVCGTQ